VHGIKYKAIHVSEHARKRIIKRIGTKPQNIDKLANKAFHSKNKLSPVLLYRVKMKQCNQEGDIYKYYLGQIFIFRKRYFDRKVQRLLITVYNPHSVEVNETTIAYYKDQQQKKYNKRNKKLKNLI